MRTVKSKNKPGDVEPEIVVEGVTDKRALVIQTEFGGTLRVMGREGNTLSAVIRDAWDLGDLRVMTKSPLVATGAHINILAHCTPEELRRELRDTEVANGFANRFLCVAVRRSKVLPDPEPFGADTPGAIEIAGELGETIEWARDIGQVTRSPQASELWRHVYNELSDVEERRAGLSGAILARAEAQVLRLSMAYALLDHSNVIEEEHLNAALALWDYSEASVRYIFGDATGDPTADSILTALRQRGTMTGTDISALFNRHMSADRIQAALLELTRLGKVRLTRDDSGPGRPVEVWTIVDEGFAS